MVRINRFVLYMVVIGSFGVFLSFLVPVMKYSVSDDIYVDPYYDPVWWGGIGLTLVPAITILMAKRTDFRTAGILFTIVGGCSLLLLLISYFRHG